MYGNFIVLIVWWTIEQHQIVLYKTLYSPESTNPIFTASLCLTCAELPSSLKACRRPTSSTSLLHPPVSMSECMREWVSDWESEQGSEKCTHICTPTHILTPSRESSDLCVDTFDKRGICITHDPKVCARHDLRSPPYCGPVDDTHGDSAATPYLIHSVTHKVAHKPPVFGRVNQAPS